MLDLRKLGEPWFERRGEEILSVVEESVAVVIRGVAEHVERRDPSAATRIGSIATIRNFRSGEWIVDIAEALAA